MTYPALIARSLNPLVYLSIGISVASGLFLLEYVPLSVVWMPIILLIFGHMVFPYLLLPVPILIGLLRGRPVLAQLVSFAWLAALLAATAALIFSTVYRAAGPDILLMVFAVSAGASPWASFCLKDRNNLMFVALVWIMLAASFAAALIHLLVGLKPMPYGVVVWGVMMVLLGLQAVIEARLNRPRV